jgi:hypothetical protein
VLIAIVFALTDAGPGAWSVDGVRGRSQWGTRWALAQLLAGLAGAATVAYARRRPAPEAEPAPVDASAGAEAA